MEIILLIYLHFGTIIAKVCKSIQPYKKQRRKKREKGKVREKIGDTQTIYLYPQLKFLKLLCI